MRRAALTRQATPQAAAARATRVCYAQGKVCAANGAVAQRIRYHVVTLRWLCVRVQWRSAAPPGSEAMATSPELRMTHMRLPREDGVVCLRVKRYNSCPSLRATAAHLRERVSRSRSAICKAPTARKAPLRQASERLPGVACECGWLKSVEMTSSVTVDLAPNPQFSSPEMLAIYECCLERNATKLNASSRR